MHAHVSNFPEDLVALFEPTGDQLKDRGLTIEEATTQPDNQQHVTLIVRNNSLESVSLQEREVLGCLQLVVLVPTSETETGVPYHPGWTGGKCVPHRSDSW